LVQGYLHTVETKSKLIRELAGEIWWKPIASVFFIVLCSVWWL